MEVELSILIATIPSRKAKFMALRTYLINQCIKSKPTVSILSDNSMDYNIGVKRNKLLARANGKYIVFIDDDDHISDTYISDILFALKSEPDCVGISGTITTNGKNEKQWLISKEYGSWFTKDGVYYRTPNHISPVKRELALKAGFPEIAHGEDAEYSKRLLPLLKTETIIQGNIYHYDYRNDK